MHGDWIRFKYGLYKGDLGLVWDQLGGRPRLPTAVEPKDIQVLVVPRLRFPAPLKNRTVTKRPEPRRVTEVMKRQAIQFNDDCYDNCSFLNALLVARIETKRVVRTTPTMRELQPYSESGLNVRAWLRYIAQLSLRFGERVIVRGGAEDGMIATFYSSWKMEASVVPAQDDTTKEQEIVSVSVHQLEREFKEGDFVRHILAVGVDSERVGTIIKIIDLDVSEEKEDRNVDMLAAQGEIDDVISSQAGRRHMTFLGNQEEAGAFSGHVRNKNKRKAESFGPHTVFVNYAPRRLEVTVLERSTLLEVRLE